MTFVGYARVSTNDQNLDGQIDSLKAAGAELIFREKLSGAKKENRPQLAAMLEALSPGDTLLVTALDRLGRSSRDLHNILHDVQARGATFRSLRESWADTTSIQGRLFISILAALAEMERELIKARTSEGRARAKAQGKRIGGPPKKLDDGQIDNVKGLLRLGVTVPTVAAQFGVSERTIQRIRNAA